ncbi:hypothetical protein BpHYR1_012424 [Brachionus plicatilis]|uniref:Uncharacterized protein n=1 Tax=Brachionus plicatilis TaxID=10195 RepID=A0A3M7SNP2_BRAPC|nr:hypothetical protein BpHYR1_012424 [Brachionus plicatilis]
MALNLFLCISQHLTISQAIKQQKIMCILVEKIGQHSLVMLKLTIHIRCHIWFSKIIKIQVSSSTCNNNNNNITSKLDLRRRETVGSHLWLLWYTVPIKQINQINQALYRSQSSSERLKLSFNPYVLKKLYNLKNFVLEDLKKLSKIDLSLVIYSVICDYLLKI